MTWGEIKQHLEASGLEDSDEVTDIDLSDMGFTSVRWKPNNATVHELYAWERFETWEAVQCRLKEEAVLQARQESEHLCMVACHPRPCAACGVD